MVYCYSMEKQQRYKKKKKYVRRSQKWTNNLYREIYRKYHGLPSWEEVEKFIVKKIKGER